MADYAHNITTCPIGYSDLLMAMYKYLRCLNYQDLASTNSQMLYSLMIKFNTPTEAKTISDKNTKALDSMVFTSNDLFQEKQNKK